MINIDQKEYPSDITLGVLAAIEEEFGVDSFVMLFDMLASDKIGARTTYRFLKSVIRGHGIEVTGEIDRALRSLTPADAVTMMNKIIAASELAAPAEAPADPLPH